jgi:hypothetical protein
MQSILTPHAIALLTAVLTFAATSGRPTDTGSGLQAACTLTLTGAQTGSSSCSRVIAIFAPDSNISAVNFSSSGGSPVVNVSIRMSGELTTKTYRSTDAGVIASVMVNRNNTSLWLAVIDPSSRKPAAGSFTLTISSVSALSSGAQGKVFRVHGSLTATLPGSAPTKTAGTVTLHATF